MINTPIQVSANFGETPQLCRVPTHRSESLGSYVWRAHQDTAGSELTAADYQDETLNSIREAARKALEHEARAQLKLVSVVLVAIKSATSFGSQLPTWQCFRRLALRQPKRRRQHQVASPALRSRSCFCSAREAFSSSRQEG